MSLIKAYNIQFLFVSAISCGFIMYYLFLQMNWWKPILAGLIFGIFTFGCELPMVLERMKELGGEGNVRSQIN